jgi:cell wall-associated NlpC family hydrolase
MDSYFNSPERLAALATEAESWLGTPFYLRGAVKAKGVDCVTLSAEIMRALGVIGDYHFPPYSLDYAKHHEVSLVLNWLDGSPRFARLTDADGGPQAGDIACFQFGRCVHHCGVMLDSLRMIHAVEKRAVVPSRLDDSTWARRLDGFYRPLPIIDSPI